jgi:rhamnose transport system ATP-binding protein
MAAPLLEAESISKSYSGVQALSGVSFDLNEGEVHALVGENGAGKSTLIKVVTGAVTPDSGTLRVRGTEVTHHNTVTAKALGIAAIYQQPALFAHLTVSENIALGTEPGGSWRRVNWARRTELARVLLRRVDARINPDAIAGTLNTPEQQLVEIARALGASARILILDEPTASLTEREVDALMSVIRSLREQSVGMIYISHRLEEVAAIADRVTVLRDGRTIATREMSSVTTSDLIQMMVGREISAVFPKRAVPIGEPVLEIRSLGSKAAGIRDVSLTVRAGEILGIAGLVGSGRTELAEVLFGIRPADSGEILLRGKELRIETPADALENGIAYVPEDRRRNGLVLEMPVADNLSMAVLNRISPHGFLDADREQSLAAESVRKLAVKTASIFSPAGNLSGGNQQKVSLGRWLATEPAVLILDEPTQGIDVGSKSEIHSLMCDLAERGLAILMISSELPEVLGMSDRVAVMHNGTLAGVLNTSEATPDRVMSMAFGHERAA